MQATARDIRRVVERATTWVLDRSTLTYIQAKLGAISAALNFKPSLRHHLTDTHPLGICHSFEASIQWVTWDRRQGVHMVFAGGRARVSRGVLQQADATVRCKSLEKMRALFDTDAKALDLIINNDIALEGNVTILAKLDHMVRSVLLSGRKMPLHPAWQKRKNPPRWQEQRVYRPGEPCPTRPEGEVLHLDDPYLASYTLDDFPRIKRSLWIYWTTLPEVCTERGRLLTEYKLQERLSGRQNGHRTLYQARALHHILTRKEPVIYDDDILAGTDTSRRIGVPIYPELGGTWFWSELLTAQARELNPWLISDEDIEILDRQVFPFWIQDNIRQHALDHGGRPELIHSDLRFALYFMWKTQAISHTVIDVPRLLKRGLISIRDEAAKKEAAAPDDETRALYRAMQISLEAVVDYSRRLARRAAELSEQQQDSEQGRIRRAELREMARICEKVPACGADTLHEAIQSIWTLIVAQHQESVNAAIVIGRVDTWLEPYLRRELEQAQGAKDRQQRIERAIELACALMLKTTDHLPMKVSAGNRLFSGSSSDQVITLGGQTAEGRSAVCDMTWIFLKATELLRIRDPNVNARFAPGVNSEAYLRRLCEVNLLTGATPSLHNDGAMVPALVEQGFPLEHARDWTATGCVEPTICGRHYGHTNCMMFNMVAPLEMALHDGVHPLLGEQVGPRSGDPRTFATYEELYRALLEQLGALIDASAAANNMLGRSHQLLKPTPMMSALFTGPMEKGKDIVDGGALYNSSGTAMVGLTDVVDSLVTIKTLVFDKKRISFSDLLEALERDFEGDEALLAEIVHRVPKFGQDHPLPQKIAADLMAFISDRFAACEHYRGGRYVPGYWSMSYHVAFGDLSGALPSGRRRGKAFTPGLTPSLLSGAPLTEQIRTVAGLDPLKMPNNIAFNVKVVPAAHDAHQQVIDRLSAYVRAYFELGGMQMQFNVVSTDRLRAAMEHPDEYRDLMVRISGYNVYFVDLTKEAQIEVVERMEHSLSG